MGVIRNGANGKGPFSAASCDVLDGFNSHDEGDEPVPLAVHVDPSSSLLERRRRTVRRSMPACADVSGLGSRGKRLSSRKVRRLDNKHFLHDLAEEDEDAMGQLTIEDFVHQSVSAFSRLLADLDNHEVWDEVLNCTGQPLPLPEDRRSNEIAMEVGTLCLLESELCLSFEREPCGEKHYRLASSFERLLLHALCQYMSLFAHSYDMEGKRWTRVRNSTAEFCRPSESLSAYLERYWTARGAC
ncbi:uncharacterized protein LOC119180959 isoform X2 [Rhipicephalus microplus]|uniref:uncharacterized protein LOC119180959 isoform X2 n=1 Tax=Rhipicephalus microplus TaxID=6941 RepID=UPI0018878FDF|nr:uncharacterized protein LOC119180959 isoform X2 [Rhipicephalus microplus]